MSDVLTAIFNPRKQTTAAFGNLGALGGAQGRRFGRLSQEVGDLKSYEVKYKPEDHFDINSYFDLSGHFDPVDVVKRY